jgi:uncharacterized protein
MSSSTEILGRFVWHELLTTDTAGAAAYYPKVVPWRTEASNMPGYTIWMAGETQVGGLMELPQEGSAAHWLVYVGTPDVDETCAKAQSLGGRVLKASTDIPNVGRFAVLLDPQGATFAVFTPKPGQPAPTPAAQGGFSWHELATTDVAGALRFYGDLFGWRKGPGHDMGPMGVYQIFEHGGTQVGGMCPPGPAHTGPSWLSYVHVADSSRAAAAAKSAGGRVVNGPMEVPGGSWIAILNDPQGSSFAVHEMPRAAATKPVASEKSAATPKPAKVAPKPAAAPKPASKPKSAATKTAKKRATATRKTVRKRKVRKAARKSPRRVASRRRARRTTRGARATRRGASRGVRRASPRRGGRGRRR